MSQGRKAAVFWYIATIVFAGSVIGAGQVALAQAQPKYVVMPVYEKFTGAAKDFLPEMTKEERKAIQDDRAWKRQLELMVGNVLRGAPEASLEDEVTKKRFDGWYKLYYFAILTHPEHLSEWPESRRKFLKLLTPSNVPPTVHDHLVDLTMQTMLTIARGNYYPVARCNAVLLIGSLNKSEAVLIGGSKRLPVPTIRGLGIMLDEFANPNQIDAVRVAALFGIHRHVKIDRQLPAENRRLIGEGNVEEGRIVDIGVGLVNAKDPPQGRSKGGHSWMRGRAIEILGLLGSVGQNGKAVAALDALAADETAPVSLRCLAAEAFGKLNYPPNTNMNVSETAKKLGAVAVYACHKEVRRVEDQQLREQKEKERTGRGGRSGGASYGGPAGGVSPAGLGAAFGASNVFDPLGYRIALTRRHVKYQTLLVRRGLVGPKVEEKVRGRIGAPVENAEKPEPKKRGILALASSADDQKYIADMVSGIDAIIEVVDNADAQDIGSLVANIRNKVNELEENCEIVVDLGEAEGEAGGADALIKNPMDSLDLDIGVDLSDGPPAKPPSSPPGKTPVKPEPKAPSKPAAKAPAEPAAKAPTKPAAKAPSKPTPDAPTKPAVEVPTKPATKTPSKPPEPAPAVPPKGTE